MAGLASNVVTAASSHIGTYDSSDIAGSTARGGLAIVITSRRYPSAGPIGSCQRDADDKFNSTDHSPARDKFTSCPDGKRPGCDDLATLITHA